MTVIKKTLTEVMLEKAKEAQERYGFEQPYVGIMTERNLVLTLPLHEVYTDGFLSEGVHYGVLPFIELNDELAKKILAKESEIKNKTN